MSILISVNDGDTILSSFKKDKGDESETLYEKIVSEGVKGIPR